MTKTKTIKIRVTEAEYRRLKSTAGKRGVSTLIRVSALGRDQTQEQTARLLVLAELARARIVLRQIAGQCDQWPLSEQLALVAGLITIERQLSKVAGQ